MHLLSLKLVVSATPVSPPCQLCAWLAGRPPQRQGLNSRELSYSPHACMANALPTELSPRPLNILKNKGGGGGGRSRGGEGVGEEGEQWQPWPVIPADRLRWGWRILGQSGLCSKTLSERRGRGTRTTAPQMRPRPGYQPGRQGPEG